MGAFNLRVSEKGIPVAVGSFAHLRSGKSGLCRFRCQRQQSINSTRLCKCKSVGVYVSMCKDLHF